MLSKQDSTRKYGGKLANLIVQTRHAAETTDPDVGAWFKVTNPALKTYGLVGQCKAVRHRYRLRAWDALLIEFGPGRRHWMRREGLNLVIL